MVELIPREVLFGNPERTRPRLSPDGTMLAWIAPQEGVLNVWVAPVRRAPDGSAADGSAPAPAAAVRGGGVDWSAARVVTDDTDRGVRIFEWSPDGSRLLYLQDTGGDENWRLYDVELDSLERRSLTPFDGVQAQVIATSPKVRDAVLIGLNKDNPELHDVYRLELTTGELTKVWENPGVVGWVADSELQVRAAVAPQPDGSALVVVPDPSGAAGAEGAAGAAGADGADGVAGGEVAGSADGSDSAEGATGADDGSLPGAPPGWRVLLEVPADDSLSTEPLAVLADGETMLLVSSVGNETAQLVACTLADGSSSVLARDGVADVTGVRLHPVTNEPQIAVFLRDRSVYQALEPDFEADLAAIHAVDPGDPVFLGGDDADSTWLLGFTNDAGPVRFYAYDREAQSASFLFEHQPALSRYELAAMEPFSFTARDGLELHGYLTFPPGEERRNLPTVLLVHGGPWARDAWGLDPQAQWLANRGYLCVQVNFRGSTGFGKSFVNAGDREWGNKMHADIVDAVEFAVSQGYSDRERVAIFGGSYGGYEALVGVTFTPGLFCCAVDVVGPSNLITLIETIPPYWAPMRAQFYRRVGNPETDADFLWSRSPLSRVEQITAPLLIAQGANDPRVKVSESEQIVARLVEAGIDHEYLLFPDEGHGFAKPENRLRFFATAEAFLARHLGGRAEP
jgi:dipeptidyl aminopeptidase/acylaminoacyl peptidase